MPMLWCFQCGARSFLDEVNFKLCFGVYNLKFDHYYQEEKPTEEIEQLYTKMSETDSMSIPLLFIERVADNEMIQYESLSKLKDEDVVRLVETNTGPCEFEYDQKLLQELKLVKLKDPIYGRHDENSILNISVPVQSYDTNKPLISYPKGMDLRHDCVYVTCEVRLLDGSLKIVKYWGD